MRTSLPFLATLLIAAAPAWSQVPKWGRFETQLANSNSYSNPFKDVTLNATFTAPSGKKVDFIGFYDGNGNGGQTGNVWKLRFMPDEAGSWSYTSSFSDGSPGKSGTFTCTNTGAKPGPLRKNGRWLKYANGTNFYPRGYYLSESFTGTSPNWETLLDKFFGGTYKYNLNCTVFWQGPLLNQNNWTNLPYNGFYPILNGDYTKLDLSAWKHVDAVLQRMESRNAVWFNFDGFVPNVGGNMGSQRLNFSAQQVYVRNVVARIGPYWNVLWNIAFEWKEFMSAAQVAQLADYTKSLDPWNHLLTVHDQGNYSNASAIASNLHVDFVTLQYNAGRVPNAATANNFILQYSGSGPVYGHEMVWEAGSKLNGDQVRRGSWGIVLAGGIVNYAEMFDGPNAGTPANYGDGAALPFLEILFDFMNALPYDQMNPANNLVNAGRLCLAKPGTRYACYAPNGGSIDLDLSAVTGSFQAEWLNPRTGARTSAGTTTGGATRSFTAPDTNDWVLDVSPGQSSSNLPPSVDLFAPTAGSTFPQGATITLQATASDPDGTVVSVEFFRGTTLLGQDTSSPYSYTWNNVVMGSTSLTARATDDKGASTTSAAVSITVTAPVNQTPTPSISGPPPGQLFDPGDTLTFSGSASDPEDGSLAGGSLTWWIDRIGDELGAALLPATGTSGSQTLTGSLPDPNGQPVQLGVPGSSYDLILIATDSQGATDQVSVVYSLNSTTPQPPSSPSGLSVAAISSSQLDLAWTDGASNEDGFRIERSSGGSGFAVVATVGAGVTTYSDTGLSASTSYSYRVHAYNPAGNSAPSNAASATTLSPGGPGIISNTSPSSYVWGALDVGMAQYIDRTYTYSAVPPSLVGLDYLQTANGDKSSQGFPWITFDVSQNVTVYVAHDDRISPKPAWMAGFVDSGMDLVSAGGGTFSLFARDFPAGRVGLGGNIDSGTTGNSMYTVVVGPPTGSGTTDTDGDGLTDVDEINLYATNPLQPDTDGDGMSDGAEVQYGLDPLDADQDANGVLDGSDDWNGNTVNNLTDIANGINPGSPPAPGPTGNGGSEGCGATGLEILLLLSIPLFRRR